MQKDPQIYLVHMLDAARESQNYIRGKTREDYDTDGMLRRSLERVVEVIGEAARLVPQSMRENNPQIPWGAIVGMRNRIVHDYLNVDADILWETVTNAIPALISALEPIVPSDTLAEQ